MTYKFMENFNNNIMRKFGTNPAKMLIYTGVLGWFLSAAAQVVAIIVNDKIPKEQKSYLIPQEIADGAVNVLSFFLITTSLKNLASKLVSTGKISTEKITKYLTSLGLNTKNGLGDVKFDIGKLANIAPIEKDYNKLKNSAEVIAMTAGTVLSCNIVTPLIRNKIAANRQKIALAKMNDTKNLQYPKGLRMEQYQTMIANRHSSGALKI